MRFLEYLAKVSICSLLNLKSCHLTKNTILKSHHVVILYVGYFAKNILYSIHCFKELD